MGLEGNLMAMRLVLERVCGRAAEAPMEAEPLDISLPRLKTAADCSLALEKLVDGVCDGTIDRGAAQTLVAVVQARLRALETTEFEKRLAQLERSAAQTESRSDIERK